MFDTLALDGPIVPDPSFRPYVDELVEFRNGVAHGRYSALGLGSARRADELLVRHDAISATCSHILDSLEQHYLARGIVAASFRELYAVAES